jgi:hypothetical protein
MKQIFEVGQEVFDYSYGWGKVLSIDTNTNTLTVEFKDEDKHNFYKNYDSDGCLNYLAKDPILSTTEYTLNNFSQKKQFPMNKSIGKWAKFWDSDKNSFAISRFEGYVPNSDYPYLSEDLGQFENFEILTEEQIKLFGLK